MKQLIVALFLAGSIYAQPSLTTVTSTVVNADGSPFTGKITIVAQAIQSGTAYVRSAPIIASVVSSVMTVQLAANDTVYPTGTPYYVVFQPTRGTPYSENWGVMQGGPYTIAQVLKPSATVAANINTLLNGTSTPPSVNQGNNGDMYLDTARSCLWGPKFHAAWSGPCVSMVGPPGSTGSAGATGPPVTFRGNWLNAVPYSTGDAVGYFGSSYIALSGNTHAQPDINPSVWAILASIGNAGAAGSAGVAGAAGPAGRTILSASGSPTGGNNGDFFIDTSVPCIYGPKASGTWPLSCTPLVGPAGSNGTPATATVGTTTTGAAGSMASVVNVGTTSSAVFNFTVPAGATGPASLTPTATGFPHVTSGALDPAARLLTNTDVQAAGTLTNNTSGNANGLSAGAYQLVFSGLANPTLAFSSTGTYTFPAPGNLIGQNDTQSLINKTVDAVSPTVFGYLVNITGDAQAQFNSKQPTITTGSSAQYLKADLSIGTTCGGCSTSAPVCWNGTAFYTAGCVAGVVLFDAFGGMFDSVADALFDTSSN